MQRRMVAGAVAGMTLLVAACGGGTASSKSGTGGGSSSSSGTTGSVATAIDSLSNGGGTITFSLFGTASDFDALSTTPSSQKDDAIANKLIPDSSLAISLGSANSGKFDLDAKIGGEDKAVDLLVTGGTLYLKVDLKGIGTSSGVDTSKLSTEAGAVSSELPFVGALVAGNYLSLDLKQASGMLKLFEGAAGGSGALGATGTTGATNIEGNLFSALKSALTTGTQTNKVGTDSIGTHYQIVVTPQTFAQAFYTAAAQIAGPLASQISKAQADISKIPNTPVTIDTWLSGGKLKQIELDLRQFHKGAGGPTNPVGLKLEISSSSPSFSAPSGATPVDLSKLGALLGGALKGTGAGTSGTT